MSVDAAISSVTQEVKTLEDELHGMLEPIETKLDRRSRRKLNKVNDRFFNECANSAILRGVKKSSKNSEWNAKELKKQISFIIIDRDATSELKSLYGRMTSLDDALLPQVINTFYQASKHSNIEGWWDTCLGVPKKDGFYSSIRIFYKGLDFPFEWYNKLLDVCDPDEKGDYGRELRVRALQSIGHQAALMHRITKPADSIPIFYEAKPTINDLSKIINVLDSKTTSKEDKMSFFRQYDSIVSRCSEVLYSRLSNFKFGKKEVVKRKYGARVGLSPWRFFGYYKVDLRDRLHELASGGYEYEIGKLFGQYIPQNQ